MKSIFITHIKNYFAVKNFAPNVLIAMMLSIIGVCILMLNYGTYQNDIVKTSNVHYQEKIKEFNFKKAELAKLQKEVDKLENEIKP